MCQLSVSPPTSSFRNKSTVQVYKIPKEFQETVTCASSASHSSRNLKDPPRNSEEQIGLVFLFNMQALEHVGLTNSLQQAFQHCYFNRQLSQRFGATMSFQTFVLMARAV